MASPGLKRPAGQPDQKLCNHHRSFSLDDAREPADAPWHYVRAMMQSSKLNGLSGKPIGRTSSFFFEPGGNAHALLACSNSPTVSFLLNRRRQRIVKLHSLGSCRCRSDQQRAGPIIFHREDKKQYLLPAQLHRAAMSDEPEEAANGEKPI